MSLKKVILVFTIIVIISILAINTHFTLENKIKLSGAAVTDLPPPPGIPSLEQPTTSTDIQADVNELKSRITEINRVSDRLVTTEDDMREIKRQLELIEDKLDSAGYYETPGSAGGGFLGTFVDIILLLAVGGLIGYTIMTKKKQEKETLDAIKNYARQSMQQGYKIGQIKPLLEQAGYTQTEINKALKEVNL